MLKDRLKELRTEYQLLQKDVATYLNITSSAYGFYEQGKRIPDADTVKKLSEYFKVSTDYLLGESNIKESADKLVKNDTKNIQETTIALHSDHDYADLPEEAKKEIDNFIEYVRNKYQK